MHELSIVSSVVETVQESLTSYPGARVVEVRAEGRRAGSTVVVDSLVFILLGIATEDTPLAGRGWWWLRCPW